MVSENSPKMMSAFDILPCLDFMMFMFNLDDLTVYQTEYIHAVTKRS
jgi:hypothetical protein